MSEERKMDNGFKKVLVGTSKGPYKEHLAVLTSTPSAEWPEKFKGATLAAGMLRGLVDVPVTVLEDFERGKPLKGDEVELWCLMGRRRFLLEREQIAPFALALKESLEEGGKGPESIECEGMMNEPLPDVAMCLVCVHATRDKRCGRAGPKVVAALQEAIRGYGRDDEDMAKMLVWGASHIGGHKFAGVCVVYDNGIGAHYGMVSVRSAPQIVEYYLNGGDLPRAHWRGISSMSPEEAIDLACSCSKEAICFGELF